MILISSNEVEKDKFINSKRKNPCSINNNSSCNSNINNENNDLALKNYSIETSFLNTKNGNNDLSLIEDFDIMVRNTKYVNSIINNTEFQNIYSNDIYFKVIYDHNYFNKQYNNNSLEFLKKYNINKLPEILFNILYNDNIKYIDNKENHIITQFQELYNNTTDESIKEFYRTNKDFQMLYLLSDKFREKYHNNKEYRDTIHDHQLLTVEFLLHVSDKFKTLYNNNNKRFAKLCNNKEILEKYCLKKESRNVFDSKLFSIEYFELYISNQLFKNLYDNDLYFHAIYFYFNGKCNDDLMFINKYDTNGISEILFNILYNNDGEFFYKTDKIEDICSKFQELYNSTTDESIKEFYRTNKDFKILYLLSDKFREKYHNNNKEYRDTIHDDKQMTLNFLLYTNIAFKKLYDSHEKFQKLCNNKEFLDEYCTNESIRNMINIGINNEKKYTNNNNKRDICATYYLYIKNSLFKDFYNNDKYFRLLYNSSNYFYEQCQNNSEFLKEYNIDKFPEILFNILYSDDIEYTKNKTERGQDISMKFQELYNNTTDESLKKFYRTNKDFQMLYYLFDSFQEQYHNNNEYRNQINTNKQFLETEYLLYTNNTFKMSYKNKKTKKLYDTNEKFQKLCNNKEFLDKYYNNINYQGKFYINNYHKNHGEINKKFIDTQYLLYTNNQIKKLYCTNQIFQKLYNSHEKFQKLCNNQEFVDQYYCSNIDYQNQYNNEDFINENFLLYTDNDFKINHDIIKENEYFKQLYSYKDFKDRYYSCINFRNSIYNDKDFLSLQFKIYNNETLNKIYQKNCLFENLYNTEKSFQELCDNKKFLTEYNNNPDFQFNINYCPKAREMAYKKYKKYINNNNIS